VFASWKGASDSLTPRSIKTNARTLLQRCVGTHASHASQGVVARKLDGDRAFIDRSEESTRDSMATDFTDKTAGPFYRRPVVQAELHMLEE